MKRTTNLSNTIVATIIQNEWAKTLRVFKSVCLEATISEAELNSALITDTCLGYHCHLIALFWTSLTRANWKSTSIFLFFWNQYNHINKRGPVSVLSHICYFNFIITSARQFTGILVWLAHDKQVFFGNISPDNRRLPRKHEMWSHYREIKIVYKLFRLNNLLLQLNLFSWNRFKQRKTKSLDVQFYAVIV